MHSGPIFGFWANHYK